MMMLGSVHAQLSTVTSLCVMTPARKGGAGHGTD